MSENESNVCLRGHAMTQGNFWITKYGKRRCRTCRREHNRLWRAGKAPGQGQGTGAHMRNLTHCIRGHEFTPENTNISKRGHRRCRACCRDKQASRRAQQREASRG